MISHGLSPLGVAGNRIVRLGGGDEVLLRGVNRSGLEYCRSLEAARITEEEMDRIVFEWRANVIRLPFNQDWALEREGYDPGAYRAALDAAIEMAARRGAYTLLDLHWLDALAPRGRNADGTENFVAPLPDAGSIDVWRQLAARYAAEPAVLFDVFNEPHDILPGDAISGCGRVTMDEWQPWAAALVNAIRAAHPSALIFVPGIDWGYDLRGHPLPGVDGVVYSTHVYRNKGGDWDGAFGELSETAPVFAGEWGGGDADLDWGRELAAYFNARRIGWTAWSWSDRPRLVRDSPGFIPTAFGELVRAELERTA